MPKGPRLGSIEKVQIQQDRLRERYSGDTASYSGVGQEYDASISGRPKYWFFWGCTLEGKATTLGPFPTENDAILKADKENATITILREYDTKRLSEATRRLRIEVTELEGARRKSLDEVLVRIRHQKSLDRERTKREK